MGIFNSLGGRPQKQVQAPTMQEFMQNPMGMLSKYYNIPSNMANNPQAMTMHLLKTGQVSNPALQQIRPLLAQMGVNI